MRVRTSIQVVTLLAVGACLATPSCAPQGSSTDATNSTNAAISADAADVSFTLTLPHDLTINQVVLGATGSLTLGDRVKLLEAGGAGSNATNTAGNVVVGTDALVGTVEANGSISLGDRTAATSLVARGAIRLGNSDIVGAQRGSSSLAPLTSQSFAVHIPASPLPAVNFQGGTHTLVPGRYAGVRLAAGASVTMPSGAYYFDSLDLEPQTVLQIADANNQTTINVRGSVVLRGQLVAPVPSQLELIYLDTGAVNVEMPFQGSILAPFATLTLGQVPASYSGSFFAKNINVGPGTTITHAPLVEETCVVTKEGNVVTQHIAAADVDASGNPLFFRSDRTLSYGDTTYVLAENGMLELGGAEVYSYSVNATSEQPVQGTVHWGALIQGATNETFSVTGGAMTGNIDGRTFLPFQTTGDPATAKFVDGQPGPVLRPTGPLAGVLTQAELNRLGAAVSRATATCPTTAATIQERPFGPTTDSDPGHFSDTYGADSCTWCKVGVGAAGVVGGFLTGVSCVLSFGLACGAAVAGEGLAVTTGITACEASGLCCPVHCANGFPSACCFGGETCLDGAGHCCSPGKQACEGKACCGSDESCITQGPNKGSCCSDTKVCGQDCCGSQEECHNSTECCLSGLWCGSTCCGRQSDPLALMYCAAPDLCCITGETACGGVCCSGDKVCTNNQCVFPTTVDCGGKPVCVDLGTGVPLVPSPCTGGDTCTSGGACCQEVPK